MKRIYVGQNRFMLVDEDVFEWASKFKWKLHNNGYAQISLYNLIHRIITSAPKGMEVHHKNGNKLDNRRCNLEILTPSQHQLKYHVKELIKRRNKSRIYPDIKKCTCCGKKYKAKPRKRTTQQCCSKKCAMNMRIRGRLKQCGKLI